MLTSDHISSGMWSGRNPLSQKKAKLWYLNRTLENKRFDKVGKDSKEK